MKNIIKIDCGFTDFYIFNNEQCTFNLSHYFVFFFNMMLLFLTRVHAYMHQSPHYYE